MNIRMTAAALLLAAGLTLTGCGREAPDDQFIFGKNRISCAGETITLEVPFEMGVDGEMADLAPKDSPKVSAEGHNQYMQILVTGELAGGQTAEGKAAEALYLMEGEGSIANLRSETDRVRVGKADGIRLRFYFDDVSRGKKNSLTVTEYIFPEEMTLWRVIYQYRTSDPVGKALTERVEGQIAQGATF